MNPYDDIIHLPHPVSKKHPQMPIENRAAQFSPFAALTGYDAAIKETARLTDSKIELDDDQKLSLSAKLQLINEHIQAQPKVTVTFFQPDSRKTGGTYIDVIGTIKKIDPIEGRLVMVGGKHIPMEDVIALNGDLFKVEAM